MHLGKPSGEPQKSPLFTIKAFLNGHLGLKAPTAFAHQLILKY